jgi:signal transduction histidine kinase
MVRVESSSTPVRYQLVEGQARPWLALLVACRLLATAVAVVLLAVDPVRPGLMLAAAGYGLGSTALLAWRPELRRSRLAWLADTAIVLALVVASNDWRSPFYLLWLTTLALPAVQLALRPAAWLALGASVTYFAVSLLGGPSPGGFGPLTYETLVIHLVLPIAVVAGLAYATEVLRRLGQERLRRERLAIESERRRIAWELHDSAKQRIHAAHLLVSALQGRAPTELAASLQRAVIELESAAAEMDTSLGELRTPLEGRPLHEALAARAAELSFDGGPTITVEGRAPELPPLVVAHLYRIASEALTNALRHAAAETIDVRLEARDGGVRLVVADDGRGVEADGRPGATGLVAMRGRAASIGATLELRPRDDGRGTAVVLDLPDPTTPGGPA